eukprot:4838645-Amphidinium_carterae.1
MLEGEGPGKFCSQGLRGLSFTGIRATDEPFSLPAAAIFPQQRMSRGATWEHSMSTMPHKL